MMSFSGRGRYSHHHHQHPYQTLTGDPNRPGSPQTQFAYDINGYHQVSSENGFYAGAGATMVGHTAGSENLGPAFSYHAAAAASDGINQSPWTIATNFVGQAAPFIHLPSHQSPFLAQPGRGRGLQTNGKPKRRRIASATQRRAANIRERRRMFNLNEAFDVLRKKVPTFAYEKRLSRIETLRLAITYMSFLSEVCEGKDPNDVKLISPRGSNWTVLKKFATHKIVEDDDDDILSEGG